MPPWRAPGNSCDSSRSPSTTATALSGAPGVSPLNCARPLSSVLPPSTLPPTCSSTGWFSDVVREIAANEPDRDGAGRQIVDRPRDARHLLGVRHRELRAHVGPARPRGRPSSAQHQSALRMVASPPECSCPVCVLPLPSACRVPRSLQLWRPHDLQNCASASLRRRAGPARARNGLCRGLLAQPLREIALDRSR